MSKFNEKFNKLIDAVARLAEGIDYCEIENTDLLRDGVIQRFEFCTELTWKSIREYLLDQGYTDINSPKSVLKTAFSDGIINDEQGWLDILNSRNITSHIYDEETSIIVYNKIKNVYLDLFNQLINKIK